MNDGLLDAVAAIVIPGFYVMCDIGFLAGMASLNMGLIFYMLLVAPWAIFILWAAQFTARFHWRAFRDAQAHAAG